MIADAKEQVVEVRSEKVSELVVPVVIESMQNRGEKAPESSREAIVLRINKNEINNAARNDRTASLDKPREEIRNINERNENVKDKALDGHEILLHILGISQAELGIAEPTNSRSVPNINQEEQETKSTKSIPSIYQQRNLNGITLKIAA